MRKLLLWLLMVALLVALLLGGAAWMLYSARSEKDLPDPAAVFGGVALEPAGYEWELPVLGDLLARSFYSPPNLTVQQLGDLGDTVPALQLPDWVTRADARLTAPDGSVWVGSGADLADYVYASNGAYRLELTLYQQTAGPPARAQGWYRYQADYTVSLQPQAELSAEQAAQGSVVALTVRGILDGSVPELTTDLGQVWFRPIDGGWMGYIPVTYNAEGGDHELRLTCGDLVQTLLLSVVARQGGVAQTAPAASSEAADSQYRNAVWPLYSAAKGEKLWQGPFAAPSTAGVRVPYGARLMEGDRPAGYATGLTYAAAPGSAVTAPQSGRVVLAAVLELTGGTVVLDHGCGVKSYLYGLDQLAVGPGQTVAAGDALGTAAPAQELIYELRIGNKSVDPAEAIAGRGGLFYRELA